MMIKLRENSFAIQLVIVLFLTLVLVPACVQNEGANATPVPDSAAQDVADPTTAATEPAPTNQDSGYPGVAIADESGYPGPQEPPADLLETPPDPERELPAAEAQTAVVGGVLIREVTDAGFVPLIPVALKLGEVIRDSNGDLALIKENSTSPQAEVFATGVFVFRGVPPGTYGLVVDVGYSKFAVNDENGSARLLEIEAGQVIDLGQVIMELPGS